MTKRRLSPAWFTPAACLLLPLWLPAAALAQVTWSGASGTDSNFSTAGNWVGGTAPASSNTTFLRFDGTGSTFNPTADLPFTLNRLDIAGPSAYTIGGAPLTFQGGAAQINASGASHAIDATVTMATDLAVNTGSSLALGAVGGFGTLTKTGAGTLVMRDAFVNSGGAVISNGTLQVGTGAAFGAATFFTDIVNNAAMVVDNGAGGSGVALTGLSGSGSLTKNGDGGLISFGPTWTHSGATTINAGEVAASILSTGRLTVNGGVFNTGLASFGSLAGTGGTINVNGGGTLTVGADNSSSTYAGTIGSSGTLVKAGTGTLVLANTPQTAGGVVIDAGTLQLGTGAAQSSAIVARDIVNNGALVVDIGAGGSGVVLTGLSGSGSLTKNGDGGLISFGPTWTHSGATTINAGEVGASILSTGRLTVNGGTFNTGLASFGSLAGTGGTINVNGGGTLTVGADNSSSTYAGTIGSSGTLVKAGTGTLVLANTPQTAGGVVIDAGTLQLGTGAAQSSAIVARDIVNNGALVVDIGAGGSGVVLTGLSGSGSLTKNGSGSLISFGPTWVHGGDTTINAGEVGASILSTGRLTVNGGTFNTGLASFGSLAGAGGTINVNGGGTLTVGADNSSSTYAGRIDSDGNLVKRGTGTLTLAGANALAGTTTVEAGRLAVNGSLASQVVVDAGGTLGGTGSIGNALAVGVGGVVAPGNSIGTLTVDASTQQSEIDGTLEIEIDGTLNDILSVVGPRGLHFGDTATIRFVLVGAPQLDFDYGFLFTDLLEGFGSAVNLEFQGLGSGARGFVFERDQDLFVRFQALAAVPLPGSWPLVALALLALLAQRITAQRRRG